MYNFVTLGYDCSPAAALRGLEQRPFALPFDWVISTVQSLRHCFEDNFAKFHVNLRFNQTRTRLIDEYGFEFPHDYPLTDTADTTHVGEGMIGEEAGKTIHDTWQAHHALVKEKYDRRIERFLALVKDTKPLIVLCRYSPADAIELRDLFTRIYNKTNVYFINSSGTPAPSCASLRHIHTERNGVWNEASVWNEAIQERISTV